MDDYKDNEEYNGDAVLINDHGQKPYYIPSLPNDYMIKDSGKRQLFCTGSMRDNSSLKPDFGLLPVYALGRVANHYKNGQIKYPAEKRKGESVPIQNWRRGMDTQRTMESLLRHALAYNEGDKSEDHLSAICFNCLTIIETEEMVRRGFLPESLLTIQNWIKPKDKA